MPELRREVHSPQAHDEAEGGTDREYVGENFNAIYSVKKGRIALVVEGPPQRVAVVQLSRNAKGGYWSVTTAYPPKNIKFTGDALWRGRQPSQSSSNSTLPLQTVSDGHGIELAKSSSHPSSTSGQSASGTTNISPSKNKLNKSMRSGLLLRKSAVNRNHGRKSLLVADSTSHAVMFSDVAHIHEEIRRNDLVAPEIF